MCHNKGKLDVSMAAHATSSAVRVMAQATSSALRKWKQEGGKFRVSLGYILSLTPCIETSQKIDDDDR